MDWCHARFRNNHRKEENFLSATSIALDIDDGISIREAIILFQNYRHIIVTTRNHQKEKGGKQPCDRFRVVLFPDKEIQSAADYRATWATLAAKYQFIDSSCKDAGRLWYKGVNIISVNETGTLIPVTEVINQRSEVETLNSRLNVDTQGLRGALSVKTRDIVNNGMNSFGERNTSMYKAAIDFKQQGYTEHETFSALSGKSSLPPSEEERAISNGFKTNPKFPPRIPQSQKRLSTEMWVNQWLTENEAALNIKTGEVRTLGNSVTMEEMIARMILDADKVGARYGEKKINHALTLWKRSQQEAEIKNLRNTLSFEEIAHRDLFVDFLTSISGNFTALDVAVLKHFIWQVKRKLYGRPVVHHIMPILVGRTGAGKTEAIKRLLKPIDLICRTPQDMTVINDERAIRVCHDSFCIFFDEMAKANKVDVDRLKNIITQSTVTYRPMRTNHTCTVSNNATFIGAANHTIKELIYDPTSARRFWQIDTLDLINWDAVNALDYCALWKAIDENNESPIMREIQKIHEFQNLEFRHMGNVEEWITNFCDLIPEDSKLADWSKPILLYESYKDWLEYQGCATLKMQTFYDQIANFKKFTDGTTEHFDVNGKEFIKKRGEKGMRYNLKPKPIGSYEE